MIDVHEQMAGKIVEKLEICVGTRLTFSRNCPDGSYTEATFDRKKARKLVIDTLRRGYSPRKIVQMCEDEFTVLKTGVAELRAALEEINPLLKSFGAGDTIEIERTLKVINAARDKYPLEKS